MSSVASPAPSATPQPNGVPIGPDLANSDLPDIKHYEILCYSTAYNVSRVCCEKLGGKQYYYETEELQPYCILRNEHVQTANWTMCTEGFTNSSNLRDDKNLVSRCITSSATRRLYSSAMVVTALSLAVFGASCY